MMADSAFLFNANARDRSRQRQIPIDGQIRVENNPLLEDEPTPSRSPGSS
jgi:hypothetical protein